MARPVSMQAMVQAVRDARMIIDRAMPFADQAAAGPVLAVILRVTGVWDVSPWWWSRW